MAVLTPPSQRTHTYLDRCPPGGVRILFVEDDPDTASAMARLLTYHGHRVQTAGTVSEALSAWRGGQFDLLITDIGLPDGSGLSIIRALSESHPVKAIVISGLGLDEQMQESREAGFAEHLVKPVSLNALQASIRRVTG